MQALDRRDLRDALRLKPVEEVRCGAHIGAARVPVSDLRGEEFEKAIAGARAGGGDQDWKLRAGTRSRRKKVHVVRPAAARESTMRSR